MGHSSPTPTDDSLQLHIKLGEQDITRDAAGSLLEISLNQEIGHAAHLTLRLKAWDSDTEALTWTDDRRLVPGASVELSLGHEGARALVFAGEIVGLELEASSSERAVLTVNAYDALHRLGRGQRSFVHEETTYAGIVRSIGQRYKLAVDAQDDPEADPERAAVYQHNLSDLEFLLKLASEIDYDLFFDGSQLVFRRSQFGDTPGLRLDASRDLTQFSMSLQAAEQLGGVDVMAFNSETKQAVLVSETNDAGTDANYSASSTRSVIVQAGLMSDAQAKARAKAELQRIRSSFLTGSCSCFGRADLTPGMMIGIDKLGERFGGNYYVSSVTHSISATQALRTALTLKGLPR